MPPIDYVGFTLIIDDIVRPDGTTYMQQLGGGGQSLLVPAAAAAAAKQTPCLLQLPLTGHCPNRAQVPRLCLVTSWSVSALEKLPSWGWLQEWVLTSLLPARCGWLSTFKKHFEKAAHI